MKGTTLEHEFVDFIPKEIRDGIIYISIEYATVVHKCCCGCGNEVVTPLSPTDWTLIFDGRSVTLDPSIGNWSFECQSHYWIKKNNIKWAPKWSTDEINAGRTFDGNAKNKFHNNLTGQKHFDSIKNKKDIVENNIKKSIWEKLKNWVNSA